MGQHNANIRPSETGSETVVSLEVWLGLKRRMLEVAADLGWGACIPVSASDDGWHGFHFEIAKRRVELPPYRTSSGSAV